MKLALLILLTSTTCLADGNRVGNGGDVIACPTSTTLLDLYETTAELQTFENTQSKEDILEAVLKNLDRLNPQQARQYKKRAADFMNEVDFKTDAKLVNIRDSKHLYKPKDKDCKVRQIAIRRHDATAGSKRFVISKDLWDKLDSKNQAALMLHEIIYEHVYKLGEENSVKARILVGYLFSKAAISDSRKAYTDQIKELKLPIYL